jgi:hypothetical protein
MKMAIGRFKSINKEEKRRGETKERREDAVAGFHQQMQDR